MTMVIVQGVFEVEPNERARFLDARIDGMRSCRREDGCLEYVLAADPLDPGRVIISERWESMDHLQRHLDGAPTQQAVAGRAARPEPISTQITVYEIAASRKLR
jgi:quinol monooxygenase YgiN